MQKGGDVFLLDTYYGFGTGLYDFTAGNNELGNPYRDPVTAGADSGGILFEGVQADGTPNTVRADATTAGTWGYRQPQANHVYDAGYIKLREASISYKFDDKMLSKLPFTAACQIFLLLLIPTFECQIAGKNPKKSINRSLN